MASFDEARVSSTSNAEKSGRIYAVHILNPLVAFDFIDLKKKESFLEQLRKFLPWTGTLILSNPGKDLFNLFIRYITLISPFTQSIQYLLDADTSNTILTDYNSPPVLKNLHTFPSNSFHFLLWTREFEQHAEIIMGYSREKSVHGPYFFILCDKMTACYRQLLEDFKGWSAQIAKPSRESSGDPFKLIMQIESRLKPLLQEIFTFNSLQYPENQENINIERLIQDFRTYWQLRVPTTLIQILWVKQEEAIPLKKGGTTQGKKVIYFDLITNEIGSTTLFKDKYVLAKLLQLNNILQLPITLFENRRFIDFSDPGQVLLIHGYAEFRLKMVQILSFLNQILIVYQDQDTSSQKFLSESIPKDVNNMAVGDVWQIKGTGLRLNCFDIHPRFDWKGTKES